MPPYGPLPPFAPAANREVYRDLLIFEERLKQNHERLQAQRRKYELFLVGLMCCIVMLSYKVFFAASPYILVQYFYVGLLLIGVTTLVLFFATGMYTEKIAYAHKFVPQANRALRTFNMYLNTRTQPILARILSIINPFSSTKSNSNTPPSGSSSRPSPGSSPRLPLQKIPPSSNPRGEIIFSSRVSSNFKDGYEKYRGEYEKRRLGNHNNGQIGESRSWSGWVGSGFGLAGRKAAINGAGDSRSGSPGEKSAFPPSNEDFNNPHQQQQSQPSRGRESVRSGTSSKSSSRASSRGGAVGDRDVVTSRRSSGSTNAPHHSHGSGRRRSESSAIMGSGSGSAYYSSGSGSEGGGAGGGSRSSSPVSSPPSSPGSTLTRSEREKFPAVLEEDPFEGDEISSQGQTEQDGTGGGRVSVVVGGGGGKRKGSSRRSSRSGRGGGSGGVSSSGGSESDSSSRGAGSVGRAKGARLRAESFSAYMKRVEE